MSTAQKFHLTEFMNTLTERNPGENLFLQSVYEVADTISDYLNAHPEFIQAKVMERLSEPDRAISFRVVWTDDRGEVHVNKGYRVQFSNAIGPYKGGIRFHPSVRLDTLKFLGFEQIFKNALTTLPMGGGKGGSDFNPKGKSDDEVMRFCQAFMTELFRHIGPNTDVPAGDIGVGGREVGYLFGQYKRLANEFTGTLTGKGITFGGSLIRPEATGYGCVYMVENMLKHNGHHIDGKSCLVSGSGNVAQYTVEKLLDLGGTVLTLSDSGGTVFDKNGVNREKLEWVKDLKNNRRGRISEYASEFGCEYLDGKRPWDIKADLAFPCATQNEIEESDAVALVKNGVKAVGEGANMPTNLEGIKVFQGANVLFAPAKAANAGGVATSGLEMSQNSLRLSWTREEVDARLQDIMSNIHDQCVEYGSTNGHVDYVRGANVAGFAKVAEAMLQQGIY